MLSFKSTASIVSGAMVLALWPSAALAQGTQRKAATVSTAPQTAQPQPAQYDDAPDHQTNVVVQPPPQQVAPVAPVAPVQPAEQEKTTSYYGGPSRGMLFTGIGVLGVSYGAAAIVAASNTLPADDKLAIPIAGPWIDLADRGSNCDATGTTCNNETTNKVLLVTDGVFQGVGTLLIIGAFLNPEHVTKTETAAKLTKPPKAEWHVVPMTGRSSYGLAAFGTF